MISSEISTSTSAFSPLTVGISPHIVSARRGVVLKPPGTDNVTVARVSTVITFKCQRPPTRELHTNQPTPSASRVKSEKPNNGVIHFYLAVAHGSFGYSALLRRHLSSSLYKRTTLLAGKLRVISREDCSYVFREVIENAVNKVR